MGITVGHAKVVTIADGTDTNLVRVTDWNSAHAVTLNLAGGEVIKYIQAGANSVSSGTVSFADGGGVTFGMATNGIITGSVKTDYLTTAAQVSHSHAFATTTTNGSQVVVGTSNSNGVTIGVPAYLTTTAAQSVQPVAYAAGGTTNNFSTLAFANSNGLSWSTGTQGVFPSVAVLTTAMVSAAGSNFLGLNSALTANGVSATMNSSGVSLNFPAFLTTAMASNAGSNFAGLTTGATNASITVNSQGINVSVAAPGAGAFAAGVSTNASGTTGTVGNQIVFFPGTNITLSQSVNAGSASVSIIGGAGGGGGNTLSRWLFPDGGISSLSSHSATALNGSIFMGMIQVPQYVTATKMGIVQGHLIVTSYNTSQVASMTVDIGIYGRLNATAVSLMSSGNASFSASWSSSSTTGVMGMRELYIPINANLTPGVYYVAKRMSLTGNNSSAATAHTISHFGVPMQTAISAMAEGFGINTAASQGIVPFHGAFTTTSGAFPATIGLTDMVHTGTALVYANYYKEFLG